MFNKTKGKVLAAALAVAMAVMAIPAGGVVEAQAASQNKVMEANVNFDRNAQSGDDSGVYFSWLLSDEEVTFGKSYSVNMKLYVPSAFMKKGRLWVKPNMSLWTGDDLETEAGWATAPDGYDFDVNSKEVTKYNDFYVVDAKMPIDYCEVNEQKADFPEGQGQIIVTAFIGGFDQSYKGSIYVDDVALVVDDTVVSTVNYENGSVGNCTYEINSAEKKNTPKAVNFTGKALEVSKTVLNVKVGKTAKIKATTTPATKVTYKTSNKKIVTVTDKGVVKGVKKGKATITVKANGKTVKVKVTVK